MGRPRGATARAWMDRLEAFTAEHRRMPWKSVDGEDALHRWVRDVHIGRRYAPPDVVARLDALVLATPVVRRPRRTVAGPAGQDNLHRANVRRRDEAAAWTVDAAARVLAAGPRLPQHRPVLLLRVEHPGASLAELAVLAGMSKDRYAAQLRRAVSPPRR